MLSLSSSYRDYYRENYVKNVIFFKSQHMFRNDTHHKSAYTYVNEKATLTKRDTNKNFKLVYLILFSLKKI